MLNNLENNKKDLNTELKCIHCGYVLSENILRRFRVLFFYKTYYKCFNENCQKYNSNPFYKKSFGHENFLEELFINSQKNRINNI